MPRIYPTTEERFWSKVRKTDSCWEWTASLTQGGYGQFHIRIASNEFMVKAHRFSWQLFHGTVPNGKQVLHKCDNRRCVNPDHLFLGTALDNIRDMMNKHRDYKARGEAHYKTAMTAATVLALRAFAANNPSVPFAYIGTRFGVSRTCARLIVQRKTWKHV